MYPAQCAGYRLVEIKEAKNAVIYNVRMKHVFIYLFIYMNLL